MSQIWYQELRNNNDKKERKKRTTLSLLDDVFCLISGAYQVLWITESVDFISVKNLSNWLLVLYGLAAQSLFGEVTDYTVKWHAASVIE